MELSNYKKIKKTLEDELSKSNNELRENIEKIKVVRFNKFDERMQMIIVFSLIPFLLCFILINLFSSFFATIPFTVIQGLITLVPLGSGILLERIIYKNSWKLDERLRKFSKSQTQSELLEEETRYQIEAEYQKNKINVIQKILEQFEKNEGIIEKLSQKYEISVKDSHSTIIKIKNQIINLEKELKKAYDDLYISSKRKVLANKFWRYRDKFQLIIGIIITTMMFGLLGTVVNGVLKNNLNISVGLSNLLFPFPTMGLIIGGYAIKSINDTQKVFNKLNGELEENNISKKIDYNEDRVLRQEIEEKMQKISTIAVELHEQYQLLESKTLSDSQVLDTINKENIFSLINESSEQVDCSVNSERSYVKRLTK